MRALVVSTCIATAAVPLSLEGALHSLAPFDLGLSLTSIHDGAETSRFSLSPAIRRCNPAIPFTSGVEPNAREVPNF